MRFGFDIDDTLIDLRKYGFSLYERDFNMPLGEAVFQAIQKVEIHEPFGLSAKEGFEAWQAHVEELYFTNCPIFPYAKETLQQLVAEGHDVFYITARHEKYRTRTMEWMRQRGFPVIDEHFYCGMADEEKRAIIEQLHLDVYVDDKPKILQSLVGTTVTPIVHTQPYNVEQSFLRIHRWDEFINVASVRK